MKEAFRGDSLPYPDEPQFFSHIFSLLVEDSKEGIVEKVFELKKEAMLSFLCDLSTLQDSFRMRAQRRAQLLASYLIDEKGELKKEELENLLAALEESGYIIYPGGSNDRLISEHFLVVLKKLRDDPNFYKLIKKFQRPLCHKAAELLIRETVGERNSSYLTDAQIRKAVLSCCFTLLRQNVGSCFATAPAILIQYEQIESMLLDLHELLTRGKLKRTFGGIEYLVPLSPSWGVGDLKKSILPQDPQAKIWMSPGLMAALAQTGIIEETKALEEKIKILASYVVPFLEKGKEMTVDELIHQILLQYFKISEEDIRVAENLHAALIFKGRGLSPSVFETGGKKREAALQLIEKEKEAKAAFKRMADNPLLKAWEFTIASFSDVKMEFSKWNLYSSLGLHPDEKGGIGEILYKDIEEKLQSSNEKMHEFHREYEIAFEALRATESLLRQAGSEAEVRRLQAEHQTKLYHMQACLDVRDKWHNVASHYASFFAFLIEQYTEKFKEYFQEIFDAEMVDLKKGIYEDSPAGFRLVYKHGRSDASLWTKIYTKEQYIDALVDFFLSVESLVAAACEWEEGSKDVSALTTQIVTHLRTKEFLESAFFRMAKVHGMPAPKESYWEAFEKKPWAYTSGGTIGTLLKTYFKRENEITVEERWVESETDLLIFILDVLKNLPPRIIEEFLKKPNTRMLMHSPTHAFLLHPGWDLLKEGWQDSGFTYTWVRDEIFLPRLQFFNEIQLSSTEQLFLVLQFALFLPPLLAHRLKNAFSSFGEGIGVKSFRESLVDLIETLGRFIPLQKVTDKLDSFLYEMLPLFPGRDWKNHVRNILGEHFSEKTEKFMDKLPDFSSGTFSAKALKEAAKACFLYSKKSIKSSFDVHQMIAKRASSLKLCPPPPLLFADSNWPNCYFAFVVNPGSNNLELWKTDCIGEQGMPMSDWKMYMDGKTRMKWGIYNHPSEYRYKI